MSGSADRPLLFGLLALRTGLVRQDQLVAAFRAWAADRDRPIGEHLVALGSLGEAGRGVIESLIELHVAAGGDGAETLATVPIDDATRARLSTLADADLDAALARVDAASTRADATRSYHVATATEPIGGPPGDGAAAASGGPRFQVLRPHARGGLGAVYVALDSEFDREVALKRIHEDRADDPDSRSRLHLEARITGGLEHPGIVPVYGLGRYEDGRPYYAMRLVQGDSLREAIEAFHKGPKSRLDRSLAFRRLLKNFTDVCNAVEYAHSRGVLHRDVKPTNVIVGKHGETLLVDWGTAKLLGTSPADSVEQTLSPTLVADSSATLPGQAMGTPAYMSPEQARGDLAAVGPRSDVYSLGATLHHLLTGRAPFQGTLHEVLRAVEKGALRPPRTVDPAIDPALEAIVLKAMATDPKARYPSARALAGDVDRWLADERVEAYPEPRARGLVRWLTRHRAGVTGLAAAGLAAIVGLAAVSAVQTGARRALDAKNAELTNANARLAEGNRKLAESNDALAIQRKRAEGNESQAIDAVKRFKDAIVENRELKNDPKLESLRKTLLKEPLAFLGRLRDRLQAENDARPEVLLKLGNVADEHALLDYEIGNRQDAVQSVRLAVDVFERLVRERPDAVEYRSRLAECQYHLAFMAYDVGRNDESLAAHRREVELYEGLVRDHPEVSGFLGDLAWGYNGLGSQLHVMGRDDEARPFYERAVEILERLARDHPEGALDRNRLAMCLANLANAIFNSGRRDEGLTAYKRVVEILERLDRERGGVEGSLAWSYAELADRLRALGRQAEALTFYERAAEIYERFVRDNPTNTVFLTNFWALLQTRGGLLRGDGRIEEARTAYERAVEIDGRLIREHPDEALYGARLVESLDDLAGTDLQASGFAGARERLLKTIAAQRKALELDPQDPFALAVLDNGLFHLVQVERGLGHREEAARVDREFGEFRFGDPRFATVNARLKDVIAGATPRDDAERLVLPQRAYDVRRFPVAFGLWEEALASDPTLDGERGESARRNAARAAAQAADGQGIDPPADPAERTRLRGRALVWLRAEMGSCEKRLASGRPEDRAKVAASLRYWGEDPELAAIRDPDFLAKLPEAERASWKTFWDDVAELIHKAE